MGLEKEGSFSCNPDRWCGDVGHTVLCHREARQKETSGFKWKLWISLPEGWGMEIKWVCSSLAVQGKDGNPPIPGRCPVGRTDLCAQALVPGGVWLSSQLAPSPPHARYPPPKQTEKFPCLGRRQLHYYVFSSCFLPWQSWGQRAHGAQERGSWATPRQHGHTGQMWLHIMWWRSNARAHNCHSTNKLLLLFLFLNLVCVILSWQLPLPLCFEVDQ